MSKSQAEVLLEQMSLKRPSPELDELVAELLPHAVSARSVQSPFGWKLISTVAVACLLAGVALGRMTLPNVKAAATWPPPVEVNSGTGHAAAVFTSFQGPPVAMLCSMSGQAVNKKTLSHQTVPETADDRCSKCHSGVTEPVSEPSFDHVHSFHRQICAKCHVVSKDWNPENFNETFLGHPHEFDRKAGSAG